MRMVVTAFGPGLRLLLKFLHLFDELIKLANVLLTCLKVIKDLLLELLMAGLRGKVTRNSDLHVTYLLLELSKLVINHL